MSWINYKSVFWALSAVDAVIYHKNSLIKRVKVNFLLRESEIFVFINV